MRNASGHKYWNSSFIMDVTGYGADTVHVPQKALLVVYNVDICGTLYVFNIVNKSIKYNDICAHNYGHICTNSSCYG